MGALGAGAGQVAELDVVGVLAVELFASFAGQATRLGEWMRDAQINTDRNLRLQFLAGMNPDRTTPSPVAKTKLIRFGIPIV